MNATELSLFVDLTLGCFTKTFNEPPSLQPPSIEFSSSNYLDHTGVIDISGRSTGCVYLTVTHALAEELLAEMGEPERTAETCRDLVGELASTISSNARSHFGEQFKISVPRTFSEPPGDLAMPFSTFVLPLQWRDREAILVIGLVEPTE
jgi:chemotaxis protein CheX